MGKEPVVTLHKNIVIEDISGQPLYYLGEDVTVPTSRKFEVTHLSNCDLVLVRLKKPPKPNKSSQTSQDLLLDPYLRELRHRLSKWIFEKVFKIPVVKQYFRTKMDTKLD